MVFDFQTAVTILIFVVSYIFIATERIHRTIVVLASSGLLLILNVLTQEEAFAAIDFNTIFLLIGMMMIVNIMKRSGAFQYLAVLSAKLAGGRPILILIFLSTVTAVVSAFLDNVTTVLLVAPVSLAITDALGLHPIPFLLSEALASNIGGAATLIGDPPNIMIGSAGNLGFNAFLYNMVPVVAVVYVAYIVTVVLIFRKELFILPELQESILQFDEKQALTDRPLALRSLFVIFLVMVAFVLHEVLHYEAATIALAGAGLLLLISKQNPEEILIEVEWTTIFFFIGLFIIVEAVAKVGLIETGANYLMTMTGGHPALTTILILWLTAFAAAFTNNIAFTAAMIPLVQHIGDQMPIMPLWWALAIGACLGGNGALTGASANLVVAGIAKKHGFPIRYSYFLWYGLPLMVQSILISTVYVYFRYLR